MRFSNPTQIKIGMPVAMAGRRFRVVGRAVLGAMEGWRTYYWNEYNLETDDGQSATLVFEETEDGPEWRFFAMFDPKIPLTAADAASRVTGEPINLDGDVCHISKVSRSQVYFVEGKPPEAEAVGTTASYFNATRGAKMLVVSWTGDEVEIYRGATMPASVVAAAFHLRKSDLLKFRLAHTLFHLRANTLLGIGLFLLLFILLGKLFSDLTPPTRLQPVKTYNPPQPQLAIADAVTRGGRKYRILRHMLVEIVEMGKSSQRHEFVLGDETNEGALLIHGYQPGKDDWVWFTPFDPVAPLTPVGAAKVGTGKLVKLDDAVATVTGVFQSKILRDDWNTNASSTGEIRYGFQGTQGTTLLLVRWSTNEIAYYKGVTLTSREAKQAFASSTAK